MKCKAMIRFVLLALSVIAVAATSPPAFINFSAKPTLTRCEMSTTRPCFRLRFNFTDADARPAPVNLPLRDLPRHIEVQVDRDTVKPFYAAVDSDPATTIAKHRVALVLFDISGSMRTADVDGRSRFEAGKSAIEQYLAEFEDGSDLVAIVPFASKSVAAMVESTPFVGTRAAAENQLRSLPPPDSRNNTALYSATRYAVERLRAERQALGGNAEALLLILTDGKNDVNESRGDDKGLLTGDLGLQAAADAVRESGVDVFPVGLGNKTSVDESALARLGTRPPTITFDENELLKAFRISRVQSDNRITVTFQLPDKYSSRGLLAGRTLHFRAKLTLADGTVLVENREAPWSAAPVATPIFEAEASDAEQRALLADVSAGRGSWWDLLRPAVVLLGMSAVLCVLWFGMPRLIWPEKYDRHSSARPVRPEYWSQNAAATDDAHMRSKRPPPGFDTTHSGPRIAPRRPVDSTVVRPATEFDPNKTRLT